VRYKVKVSILTIDLNIDIIYAGI